MKDRPFLRKETLLLGDFDKNPFLETYTSQTENLSPPPPYNRAKFELIRYTFSGNYWEHYETKLYNQCLKEHFWEVLCFLDQLIFNSRNGHFHTKRPKFYPKSDGLVLNEIKPESILINSAQLCDICV